MFVRLLTLAVIRRGETIGIDAKASGEMPSAEDDIRAVALVQALPELSEHAKVIRRWASGQSPTSSRSAVA